MPAQAAPPRPVAVWEAVGKEPGGQGMRVLQSCAAEPAGSREHVCF